MALHTGSTGPPIRANTMEPEVLRQVIALLAPGSGVVGTNDFAVSQNGTPNMSVNVASGFAVVQGGNNPPVQGAYSVYNDAAVNVTIPASNPTNPRIDIIVLTIQDAYYSGTQNVPILQDVAGTPAPSPSAPATPTNSLLLAQVAVGANVSSVTNANITDYRTGAGGKTESLLGVGSALNGTPPGAGGGFRVQAGTTSGTTGADGRLLINFPAAFPHGLLSMTVVAINTGGVVLCQIDANSASQAYIMCKNSSTAAPYASTSLTLSWIAVGF